MEMISEQAVREFFLATVSRRKSYHEFLSMHASELAPGFNSFDFIQPDENRLSDIIAFLIDPKETHSQGDTFLRCFLEMVAQGMAVNGVCSTLPSLLEKSNDLTQTKIGREKTTTTIEAEKRRIDIVVELSDKKGRFGIGIENKPWAGDQERQIFDYARDLHNRFGGRFCCVYLSHDGTPPTANSICQTCAEMLQSQGKMLILSYSRLGKWIAKCRLQCASDRVRSFLKDFELYIQQNFEGDTMMDRKIVVDQALANDENLTVALMIPDSIDEIKEKLLNKLREDLEKALTNGDLKLDWHLRYGEKEENDSYFAFSKEEWKKLRIAIATDYPGMNEMHYGVARREEADPDPKDYIANDHFREHFGEGVKTDPKWYLWMTYFDEPYRSWGHNPEPWVDINNGKMADYIIQKVVVMCADLQKLADTIQIEL